MVVEEKEGENTDVSSRSGLSSGARRGDPEPTELSPHPLTGTGVFSYPPPRSGDARPGLQPRREAGAPRFSEFFC